MRKIKYLTYYLTSLGIFVLIIVGGFKTGRALEFNTISIPDVSAINEGINGLKLLFHNISGNLHNPLAILMIQIVTILFIARLFGLLFTRVGQPMVIGEIVAGIILGPSVFGAILPEVSSFLFPPESLHNIYFLSQIGLILFMFVIGMDLDLTMLRSKASDAMIISYASIIVPFAFGVILSYFLYPRFVSANIPFHSFALFICIAMSITAFPVLARIIQEKGWTKTHFGTIAITSAAVNDVIAWCLLAIVIALVKAGSVISALGSIIFSILYVCFMILVLKPLLVRIMDAHPTKETMNKGVIAFYFLILLASAYTTELLGIHALFGAFIAGISMPSDRNFRKILIEKIEDISLVLLLPLFFVYTGLRTQLGLLNEGHLWIILGIVVAVAVVGKFMGSALSARLVGQSWRDSLSLGALMNTRGLMELVVLNIGYDLGILSPQIFVIMVLMALITTFMTGPTLSWINRMFHIEDYFNKSLEEAVHEKKILISYGPSATGVKLLRLASDMSIHDRKTTKVTSLHFTRGTDLHPLRAEEFANESFKPVLKEAVKTGIQVVPKYKVTDNVDQAILKTAEQGNYDLLLIGAGKASINVPLFNWFHEIRNLLGRVKIFPRTNGGFRSSRENNLIHEKARYILEHAKCNVGVFIDRDYAKITRIFLPVLHRDDLGMLSFLKNFMVNEEITACLYDKSDVIAHDSGIREEVESMQDQLFARLHLVSKEEVEENGFFGGFQLMLISLKGWKQLVKYHKSWMMKIPSTLIIKIITDTTRFDV